MVLCLFFFSSGLDLVYYAQPFPPYILFSSPGLDLVHYTLSFSFLRPWPTLLYPVCSLYLFFSPGLDLVYYTLSVPVSFLFSRLSLLYSVPVSFLFPRPWPSLLSSIPWSIFFFSPGLDLVYYVGEEFDIILLQIILAFLSIFYTSVCLWCVVCVFAVVVVVIIICSCSVSLCIFSGSCWNPLTYRPSTTSL